MVVKVESCHIDTDERLRVCINEAKRDQRSLGNRRRKRHHVPHKERPVTFVQQRNYRERTRVHAINDALEELRHRLPVSLTGTKLSKTDILRKASEYINDLRGVINYGIKYEAESVDCENTRINSAENRTQCDSGSLDSLNSSTDLEHFVADNRFSSTLSDLGHFVADNRLSPTVSDLGHFVTDNRLSPTLSSVSDGYSPRIQMTHTPESSPPLSCYSMLGHQNTHNAMHDVMLDIRNENLQHFNQQHDPRSVTNFQHLNMMANCSDLNTGTQLWNDIHTSSQYFCQYLPGTCYCEDCIYHSRVLSENNFSDINAVIT